MKWYLYITTEKGTFLLNYYGFKTKREAEQQAKLAQSIKEVIRVKVVKQ